MATAEERLKILKMIQEGKITAEEGARLLSALKETRTRPTRSGLPTSDRRGWLRVRVTDMTTGRAKVNVNLPLSLMESGLLIGAQYAPELGGIDVQSIMAEIRSGASGKIIDVVDEEDREHVEIFIE
jgi:hypothetical protein